MITFILNDREVRSTSRSGTPLLDVLRSEFRLKGAKLACGEGECGACTILIGSLTSTGVEYRSVNSCILPIINVNSKHVVTIEGLNGNLPGLVQSAMIACNGTQCGFCTPGFVVSMTGGLLGKKTINKEELITAMDGNVCRCTGYKSIERAAEKVAADFNRLYSQTNFDKLGVLSGGFKAIEERLKELAKQHKKPINTGIHTGGGTDLYVQKPLEMRKASLHTMTSRDELKGISVENDRIHVGAGETMSDIQYSTILQRIIPEIKDYLAPIASTQIRNVATLGGNLINASPIGDLTILFLGLDADIVIEENGSERNMKLKDFYLGYKTLAKTPDALVKRLEFDIPTGSFHFERVCKRSFLDVASVNSACQLQCDSDHMIRIVHLSAGGIAPVPKYLHNTVNYLRGKRIGTELILKAHAVMQDEISPISDIRGTAEYKRLLMRQQFYIHMTKLSPVPIAWKELIHQ